MYVKLVFTYVIYKSPCPINLSLITQLLFIDNNKTTGDLHDDTLNSLGSYRWTHTIIASAKLCYMNLNSLYDLYGTLSDKIHGQPWDGPGVLVLSCSLPDANICFIKSLAESINLNVQEVA